jgi:hypothetical protein
VPPNGAAQNALNPPVGNRWRGRQNGAKDRAPEAAVQRERQEDKRHAFTQPSLHPDPLKQRQDDEHTGEADCKQRVPKELRARASAYAQREVETGQAQAGGEPNSGTAQHPAPDGCAQEPTPLR